MVEACPTTASLGNTTPIFTTREAKVVAIWTYLTGAEAVLSLMDRRFDQMSAMGDNL